RPSATTPPVGAGWASPSAGSRTRSSCSAGAATSPTGSPRAPCTPPSCAARSRTPGSAGSRPPRPWPCLAAEKVRYVGEGVAVVVADSRYLAEDALELIEVEYEPLPPVTDPEGA